MTAHPAWLAAPSPTTTLAALDICGFGTRRDPQTHLYLRRAMYALIDQACRITGVPWGSCYHEDRGDGALFIAPPSVAADRLLDPFAHHLTAVLRRHNRLAGPATRLRLRLAVHIGQVHPDAHGVAGPALVHLFRLLEAPAFKEFADAAAGALAMIVSDRLYTDATDTGGLVDPAAYRPLDVVSKETRTRAWAWTPPTPAAVGHAGRV